MEGTWYDPARDGEGFYLEPRRDGGVVVTWYTYPAAGTAGEQLWLVGEGRLQGNGLEVELLRVSGGRFAGQFDPANVVREPWGRATFVFEDDAHATVRYAGPAIYGSATRNLTRLSRQRRPLFDFATPPPRAVDFAGAYYDPAHSGEGIFVHVTTDAEGGASLPLVYWYSFDENGQPAWLVAVNTNAEFSPPLPFGTYAFDVLQPVGTRFGADFDPAAVQRRAWGSLILRFTAAECRTVEIDWNRRSDGVRGQLGV